MRLKNPALSIAAEMVPALLHILRHSDMSTEAIAIIISCCSIVMAAVSLGWNIYRDVVLRARLKVKFGIRKLVGGTLPEPQDKVVLSVVNMGPGTIKCTMIHWRNTGIYKRLTRKSTQGVLIHDYSNPLSGQLPCKLEVGENTDFLFPIDDDCILGIGVTHIGIADSFGRTHWAQRKEVLEAIKRYKKKFKMASD